MIAIIGMGMVMYPAKPVIQQMSSNDKQYCGQEKPGLIMNE